MTVQGSKDEQLIDQLQTILTHQDLSAFKQVIEKTAHKLQISHLDCAAALYALQQKGAENKVKRESPEKKAATPQSVKIPQIQHKFVRYRLNVGQSHQVDELAIKKVLVDVSGVDINRIRNLHIRNHYTLVDLPDGMTADIFQLLSETEVNQQKLNIKRVKVQRNFRRRRNKMNAKRMNRI